MKIQIDKEIYKQLSDDDKIRFIFVRTNKDFENDILEARKNLNLSASGIKKQENYSYGTKKPEFFILDSHKPKASIKRWKNTQTEIKRVREELIKEVSKIIDKYPLFDERWNLFLENLIFYNQVSAIPSGYSIGSRDGFVYIKIAKLKSINDLIGWIKGNWKSIKMEYLDINTTPIHRKRRKNLPDYKNLERIIEIIDLKDNHKLSFSQIMKRLYKYAWYEGKSDEKKAQNFYYKIKEEISELLNEAKNQRETNKEIQNA